MSTPDKKWWKASTVYQIYPASFLDSTGNGFGDLNGITSKLDYIKDLGVDIIWLSPIYASPLADMGYDISDYKNLDPRYGTLEDWDVLLGAVHERGMKLMMDLVVNHTSDEHQWFVESRASKSNPKRDWYIWRPPRYDSQGKRHPPNNWKSVFQGSAWTYDEPSDEYYLHLYVSKQPDLNWDNPEVRKAVWDVMNFWINRGCDGFRMDVINLISKVEGLPDAPVTLPKEPYQPASQFYANGPRVHEFLQQMHKEVLTVNGRDLITVGETPFTHDASVLANYVLPSHKELQMVFQFELMDIDSDVSKDFDPFAWRKPEISELGRVIERWQTLQKNEGYWNAIYTENHDQARSVSRFGDDSDQWRSLSSKLLAILQITQSGTQYVYQGQELGLRNAPKSWGFEEYKDVAAINYYKQVFEERKKEKGTENDEDVDMSDILEAFQKKSRDHARLPIPWDDKPHGGFSTPHATPWMRAHDDYPNWNAAKQVDDPESVFSFWKKALAFRKVSDTLIYGNFELVSVGSDPSLLAYTRTLGGEHLLVILNFSHREVTVTLGGDWTDSRPIFGNYAVGLDELIKENKFRSWEAVVLLKV